MREGWWNSAKRMKNIASGCKNKLRLEQNKKERPSEREGKKEIFYSIAKKKTYEATFNAPTLGSEHVGVASEKSKVEYL